MLADVLTTAASWRGEQPLLTYVVPEELAAKIRPGQLVAIPYSERLVEGVVWQLRADEEGPLQDDAGENSSKTIELRPVREILDEEPALLAHQMALATWIAEYYVTPLSQVAQMMLPPGLVQRSRYVLKLAETDSQELEEKLGASLSLRALIGLLIADGEIDVKRLREMLGPSKANRILKEVKSSHLVEYEAQLHHAKARPLLRKTVQLIASAQTLAEWRMQAEAQVQAALAAIEQTMASPVEKVAQHASSSKAGRGFNPWALPEPASIHTLEQADPETQIVQHQLAAIDLLQQGQEQSKPWTVSKLCKASGLSEKQLQILVQAQLISIEKSEVRRDPLAERSIPASAPLKLTEGQQQALQQILGQPRGKKRKPILLHGVTGSGKTEVYLQALASIIAQGKRGIVLVPEIALTTQAVQRVAGRFPNRVAIIHSDLSMGERYDEWRRIRSGQVDIVIGSRSAIFAPLPDLGIVILDEEHEPAYKQSDFRPTYHAREVAKQLSKILDIPVVLGSATPAVETYKQANSGAYKLIELPGRIGASLPPVEIIDLRNELHAGNTSIISRRLQEELENVLKQRQQAILFLNRRGAASCVLCRSCGFVALCDQCDIPLTYHATERVLLCHYCGKRKKVLALCPYCHSDSMRYFGLGTEKVQATIQQSFPEARLLRWDRDTARNRRAHEELLDRFANREADILIGTQMIAKGLDLPGVTLVGVVSADIALSLPDYSTTERAFTLLTQVAGRAGRGKEAGKVIIQTFNPQHFCIDTASRHDYHEFYGIEIEARQQFGYPPFRRFVKFTYRHENRQRCYNEALILHERLQEWITRLDIKDADIVGPAPAVMEKVRGKYHWHMIVRGPDLHRLLRVIDAPEWDIDIDPLSTL